MAKDLNKPLSKKELEKLQKKLKGGSPGQVWKKAGKGKGSNVASRKGFEGPMPKSFWDAAEKVQNYRRKLKINKVTLPKA